jgi:hypothetical protein
MQKVFILLQSTGENILSSQEIVFYWREVQKNNLQSKLFILSPDQPQSDVLPYLDIYENYAVQDGLTMPELERAEENGNIAEYRKRILDGSILEIFEPSKIDNAIGLENTQDIIEKMFLSGIGKGTLLLGVPGVGKSLLAKNLAKKHTVIKFNISRLYNKYVGGTEQRLAETFSRLKSFGKAIVFIDEFEKAMAGGNGDSGVSKRLIGELLQWLESGREQYVIATANDISQLPLEMLRTGRWDFILGILPPPTDIRKSIIEYYSTKYNVPFDKELANEQDITGADIESIYRLASIIGLAEAKKFTKLTKSITQNWDGMKEIILKYAIPVYNENKFEI